MDDEEINDEDYAVELYEIKDGDNEEDDEVDNDEGGFKKFESTRWSLVMEGDRELMATSTVMMTRIRMKNGEAR